MQSKLSAQIWHASKILGIAVSVLIFWTLSSRQWSRPAEIPTPFGWRPFQSTDESNLPAPSESLEPTSAIDALGLAAEVYSSPATKSRAVGVVQTTTTISDSKGSISRLKDLLIMYAYHETENAYQNARFFIDHGLHNSARFIFIVMGYSPLLDASLPKASNVEIFRRNNTCFDMGAYGDVIQQKAVLTSVYKRFILLNASIRGPFLPTWSSACWSTLWLNSISDKVKLQGMSVNCAHGFHIQSMIIGTDLPGLESMVADGTFDCADTLKGAGRQEVDMARKIKSHGWEVNAWMTAAHGDTSYANESDCHNRDVLFDNKYFGFNVHPYETIFAKTNRNVSQAMVNKMTEWHDYMNYSSYDYC